MRAPKEWEPVVVAWEDAHTDAAEQYESPAGAREAYSPYFRKSVGIWLGWTQRNGRECAVFATEDDRSPDRPSSVGGISYVPKGMVISIEPLCLHQRPRK